MIKTVETMEASRILIEKIKEFEGLRLSPYRCAGGVWTIGYGHTSGITGKTPAITKEQAEKWLRSDLIHYEAFVDRLNVTCKQCKFDALVDFAFNLGTEALSQSTLLKKIRACSPDKEVRAEFMKWVNAKGKKMNGLVKRRQWEADRYFGLV